MNDVLHVRRIPGASEVPADGTGGSGCRIGRTHHGAHAFDDALAFNDDRDQGAGAHEVQEALEEGLACVVAVVLGEDFTRGDHDLQALDDVALRFDAAQDLSGQTAGVTVGLDEDEGVLQRGIQ